jgi:serine protease
MTTRRRIVGARKGRPMHRLMLRQPLLAAVVVAAGWLASVGAQAPAPPDRRLTADRAEALARALRDGLDAVPGEVLVKFKAGVAPAAMARALGVLRGGSRAADQRWIGDLLLVSAGNEPDPRQAAERLAAQPEVEFAQPNHLMRFNSAPNDPFYGRQWHMDLIRMPQAWDINPGGATDVTVAVIDSGVTTVTQTQSFQLWTGTGFAQVPVPFAVNPDLDAARFTQPRDFVFFADGQPVVDMVGHGTHVAGTVAQSTNNGLGLAGVAYQARLMPLKACVGYWELQMVWSASNQPGFIDPEEDGGCPTDAVIEAVRYAADNGAKVINLSLGSYTASPAYRDALRYAVSRGAFVAMSAGNGYEEGNRTSYPASYAAEVDGAVSVGAVGRSSRRAYYSQTGAWLELAAPGGDDRDGGLNGLVVQSGLDFADFDPFTVVRPRFDRYVVEPNEGTSMAAPHVAGVAALLYSQGVTNPAAIEAALKRFAVDLGPAGRDDEYGAGLIDARATLRGLGIAR